MSRLNTRAKKSVVVNTVEEEATTVQDTTEKTTEKTAENVASTEVEVVGSKVFKDSDLIPCHSVCTGGTYMIGEKTNELYSFAYQGDVQDVEYRDLVSAVHTRSSYLFTPFIIVDDEDFVEQNPSLKEFYSSMYTTKDLKAILKLNDNKLAKVLETLPEGIKTGLKQIAVDMISSGELRDIGTIRTLDKHFNTELAMYAIKQ